MKKLTASVILFSLLLVCGCRKFLEEKSDKRLVIPATLSDLQALLDNYLKINLSPSAQEVSSDDYYITDADYAALTVNNNRRMYTWEGSLLFDVFPNSWSRCYDDVYYANIVLEGLTTIERNAGNAAQYDNVTGQALFIRGFSYLQAAFLWCRAYEAGTAKTNLGLPLRLNSDFNLPSERSDVESTFDQILGDLQAGARLLPATAVHVMRPAKPAAYAALAKTYLYIRDYKNAGAYADSSLRIYNTLLDYNTLSAAATFPLPAFNAEIIYQTDIPTPAILNNSRAKMDSSLFLLYEPNDLRKTIFFKNNNNGSYGFKGSYDGSSTLFGGLATDEQFLIRAESNARQGSTSLAMNDLNALLIKRWKAGTFIPLTAVSAAEALNKILTERRKELLMRGIRWTDLKRLNLEGANIVCRRLINGQGYMLLPGDPRYALPIPEDVIQLSGMTQNPK